MYYVLLCIIKKNCQKGGKLVRAALRKQNFLMNPQVGNCLLLRCLGFFAPWSQTKANAKCQ